MTSSKNVTPRYVYLAFGVVFFPPAIVLFGSRWLSQVPIGPIYLYDLVLGIAAAIGIFVVATNRHVLSRRSLILASLLLVIPFLALLQLIFSGFSLMAMREFAPFLYLTFGWFVAVLYPLLPRGLAKKGVMVVIVSLGLHWLWMFLLRIGAGGFLKQDLGLVVLFQKRSDIDTTLVGAFAAILLIFALKSGVSTWQRVALFGGAVLVASEMMFTGTRAGHLATVSALLAVVLYFSLVDHAKIKSRLSAVSISSAFAAAVLVVPLLLPNFLSSYSEESSRDLLEAYRGAAVVLSSEIAPDYALEGSRSGTASARINTWTHLGAWILSDTSRTLVGSGFGSGYMFESGALEKLIGKRAEARANEGIGPHNFLFFVAATMGVPLTVLFMALLAGGVTGCIRAVKRQEGNIYPLALILLVGVVTASLFGVVFEAPHGAIPLAWALGVAMTGYVKTAEVEEKELR